MVDTRHKQLPLHRSRRHFLQRVGSAVGAGALLNTRVFDTQASAASLADAVPVSEEEYWRLVRGYFELDPNVSYFNTGTLGAVPHVVASRVQYYQRMIEQHPHEYGVVNRLSTTVREKAAELLGADVGEIALVRNTTEGMSCIANGLKLQPGDEVLMTDHEHPGGRCCWELKEQTAGIRINKVQLPVPAADPQSIVRLFQQAITAQTKVISLSHVTFSTGLRLPVKAICTLARENGIFTALDGAHPVGMFRFNLHDVGCDFYASSPHKWMLAPIGNGILYVRKESQEFLAPTIASGSWQNKDATKYQSHGTVSFPVRAGLGDAIDFHHRIGAQRIEDRIMSLADYFRTAVKKMQGITLLSASHPELLTPVNTIRVEGVQNRDIYDYFRKKNVILRLIPDLNLNAVRISTHIYNSYSELDMLLAELRLIVQKGLG